MEVIPVDYFPNPVDSWSNGTKYGFHTYISYDTEQDACDSYTHMLNFV